MDTQAVEIVGRNHLISQLVTDGLEVARPERDRGVDLIAYLDLDETGGGFVACPIQMKAATTSSFGIDGKYEKFSRMLFAHVWHVSEPDETLTYALTYDEASSVADAMGWTRTASWQLHWKYDTTRPSARLLALLQPHLMHPGAWKQKVRQAADPGDR